MTKRCTKCGTVSDLAEFYRKKDTPDQLTRQCRECIKNTNNIHYQTTLKHDPRHKARAKEASRAWHLKNKTANNARTARTHRLQREQCFEHYGKVCACCGEHRYEFLSIDHINGGGIRHRREAGFSKVARWLVRNGFPTGFRVLCHNCNMAMGQYGFCPHQSAEKAS